jgi:hypothetical protein
VLKDGRSMVYVRTVILDTACRKWLDIFYDREDGDHEGDDDDTTARGEGWGLLIA